MSEQLSADAIQRRMRHVRREIDEDVDEIIASARTLANWRSYVQQYPWVCIGAAAAVGYLVVPKRVQIISPDAATIAKLAKRNQLVVKPNPKPHEKQGFAGFAFGLLANAALRGATGFIGQQLGRVLEATPDAPGNSAATAPSSRSANRPNTNRPSTWSKPR